MTASIIITSYNYGHYISEAIESVLKQSFSDFELIIVDDQSTDNSLEIIQTYAQKDPRIKVIEHQQNQGVLKTVENGFNAAKGRYVHCLSADDQYLSNFLEKTIDLLEKHPEIGLACSDYGYFYDENPSTILTTKLIPSSPSIQVFPKNQIISIFQNSNFWIPGHTCIARREFNEKIWPL